MLIDSNILVYAFNTSSPKHKKAQGFIQNNIGNLEIAHQNIFETLRVLTHPKFSSPMNPKEAVEAVFRISKTCRLIYPDYKTAPLALAFVERHNLSADRIFDGYLVATAISNDVKVIVTDNVKDFQKFPIKVFNPFS